VYFTLEQSFGTNEFGTNEASDLWVLEEVKATNIPGDIESVLSIITNSITNLTVLPDASKKRIYHLIDKEVFGFADYPMKRVLDTIKFEGNGRDFVRYIGKTVTNLINQVSYDGMFDAYNAATPISIDEVKVTVRDALSNGVDLRGYNALGYNRLIWTAYTDLETHQTEVHFIGPMIDVERFKSLNRTNTLSTNKP
jgi:hypothetical protein